MILTASVVNGWVLLTVLPRAFVADAIRSVSHMRQVFVSCSLPPFYFCVCTLVAATLAGFSLYASHEHIYYRTHLFCAQSIGRGNNQTKPNQISCQILNLCSVHTMKRWFSFSEYTSQLRCQFFKSCLKIKG